MSLCLGCERWNFWLRISRPRQRGQLLNYGRSTRRSANARRKSARLDNGEFSDGIVLTCSFGGASGMVLLDIVARLGRGTPVIFLDTDLLFQTFPGAVAQPLTQRYLTCADEPPPGRPALSLSGEQARREGPRLYERDPDRCCGIRKVAPLAEALRPYRAWDQRNWRDWSAARAGTELAQWSSRPACSSSTRWPSGASVMSGPTSPRTAYITRCSTGLSLRLGCACVRAGRRRRPARWPLGRVCQSDIIILAGGAAADTEKWEREDMGARRQAASCGLRPATCTLSPITCNTFSRFAHRSSGLLRFTAEVCS